MGTDVITNFKKKKILYMSGNKDLKRIYAFVPNSYELGWGDFRIFHDEEFRFSYYWL
jgi:hypothetical protein